MRIDRHVVHEDFVMQIRTGGSARLAQIADDLAASHMLSGYNCKRGKVCVESGYFVAVIEQHFAAVSVAHVGFSNVSVGGGAHRRAIRRVDVDAGMECALAVDGIFALTEAGSYTALEASAVQSPE